MAPSAGPPPSPGSPPGGSWRDARVPGEASTDRTTTLEVGPGVRAHVLATDRRDGDLRVDGDADELDVRRRGLVDRPWVWLRQVHGADVVVLDDTADPASVSGRPADAVVTRRADVALAVHSADCATVALVGRVADPTPRSSRAALAPAGAVLGAVHAGWRGLVAGVVPATVDAMRALGAVDVRAVLGPCIGVECYQFGADDLAEVVAVVGPAAAGRTRSGAPALDLRLGMRHALRAAGVEVVASDQRCTACGPERHGPGAEAAEPPLYSHRARRETGRQALVAWLEVDPAGAGR